MPPSWRFACCSISCRISLAFAFHIFAFISVACLECGFSFTVRFAAFKLAIICGFVFGKNVVAYDYFLGP